MGRSFRDCSTGVEGPVSALNVLVTGATGFVGRHLVAALLARGHRVRALARDASKAADMPWIDDVEFIAADIHGPHATVATWVEGIDVLLHLAWPGLPNYRALFHFELDRKSVV